MNNFFKFNIYVLIFIFNISAVNNVKLKKGTSKKAIAKSLLVKNKIIKQKLSKKNNQRKKLGLLQFVLRRFGTNPAAAALRPPIFAKSARRF
ncbi:MAG: hypothetical protein P4L22_06740 [Candidatus Babeliales bacterium]|nr:hypothetical protein [Candidatus Babeliales bacterium]